MAQCAVSRRRCSTKLQTCWRWDFISRSIICGHYLELFSTFCTLLAGLAPLQLGLSVKWGCNGQNQHLEIGLVLAAQPLLIMKFSFTWLAASMWLPILGPLGMGGTWGPPNLLVFRNGAPSHGFSSTVSGFVPWHLERQHPQQLEKCRCWLQVLWRQRGIGDRGWGCGWEVGMLGILLFHAF